MEKKIRKIKLQAKFRPVYWREYKKVPCLTMSGVWLEQHGFKVGDTVAITVEENQLIIKNIVHGNSSH